MGPTWVVEALVVVLAIAVSVTFQVYCQRCQRRRADERFSTIQNTSRGVRELRRVIDRGTPYPLNQVQRPDPVNHRGVLGAPLWIEAPQVQEPPVQEPPVQEPPVQELPVERRRLQPFGPPVEDLPVQEPPLPTRNFTPPRYSPPRDGSNEDV